MRIFYWRRRRDFIAFIDNAAMAEEYVDASAANDSERPTKRQKTMMSTSKVFFCPDHFKEIAAFL
jgi:hypothetical protein